MTEATIYLPVAHIGHWWWVFLFVAPAFLVLGGAIRTAIQERRKAKDRRSGDAS
jgi:hypothetical protein